MRCKFFAKRTKTERCLFNAIWCLNFILLGGAFNFIGVVENGGRMPVYTELNIDTPTHFSFQNITEVEKWYLTDIFSIGDDLIIYSLGDFMFIFSFLLLISFLIQFLILKRREKKNESREIKNFSNPFFKIQNNKR